MGRIAAVTDRGLQRRRNEDSYAIDVQDDRLLAVVCDGIASTDNAGPAAAAAARAALASLTAGASTTSNWQAVACEAVAAAQQAVVPGVCEAAPDDGSTTLTLAMMRAGEIVVANVGDSRAYWIGDDGRNLLLSIDDSWENLAVAAALPQPVARDRAHLHEITAWLGPDAEPVEPHLAHHYPESAGLLVVCSDGLWHYAELPDLLSVWVRRCPDRRPGAVARHLVDSALEAGGADNVTVAVLAHSPQPAPVQPAMDGQEERGGDEHL